MAETDLPFGVTLDTSLIGTTTNADGTEATGTHFGTDFGAAADEDPDLWKSANLGDLGFLKPFFEASKKGLELHKQNAAFIKEIYEINKALMLATIDPIFAAIQAILDEILKLLKDLRGLGFYMLPVHAQSVSSNVERNPMTGSLFYGGKTWVQAKRVGGDLYPADITKGDKVALDPISGEINYVEQTIFKDLDDPEQDVGGAIDKYFVQMNKWTGMVSLTPGGILQTIDDSFDDQHDVPKHIKAASATGKAPSLSDYLPDTDITGFDNFIDPSYYQSGRPIMSSSSKVGGIIFILGMPDFNKFTTILESFNNFIDIKDFSTLLDDVKKLWDPQMASHEVLVKHVATVISKKAAGANVSGVGAGFDASAVTSDATAPFTKGETAVGSFRKQKVDQPRRIMCAATGVVARVANVKESKNMLIEHYEPLAIKAGQGQGEEMTESRLRMRNKTIKKNKNTLPYQQQILEVIYETPDGVFERNDIIWECVPINETNMPGMSKSGEIMGLASEKKAAESSPVGKMYGQVKPGKCVAGRVVSAFDSKGKATPPNWYGKSLEQLFPQLGPLLNKVESEVRGVKATVANARTTIDPIIKWLDEKIDDVMLFAADIEKILDLFANGIPAAGMYTLYLEPRAGGVAKFRERMLAAGGPDKPPEDLKFCAGVCFLGGGPDGNPLLKSIDMLSLLLGLRKMTEEETATNADMKVIATPPFSGDTVYQSGDEIFYKGSNYVCIGTNVSGELPLIKDPIVNPDTGLGSGDLILNAQYWKKSDAAVGADETVDVGDDRTPAAIMLAKSTWLKTAKARLGEILIVLIGESGGMNLRKKINQVSLFGSVDAVTEVFTGENKNVYIELKQLRDSDLNELELLVLRIEELLSAIEISLIQASPDTDADSGSLRTKGKSLLMINGEFVDYVDDFDSGQRKIRQNTTITILNPLLDMSSETRSVEKISNTTVAVLNEPFSVDIDTALSFDVALRYDQTASEYANDETNRANNTHYYHPGYRLREFSAKANTISVIMPDASSGEYPTLPRWQAGQAGPQGAIRTSSFYPDGTIIKLNGTMPVSEGYVTDATGDGVEVLGTELDTAATWRGLGVSTDDKLIVNFGTEKGNNSKVVQETIGDEYLAVTAPFQFGTNPFEQFLYHEDWKFEISSLSQAEEAKKNKIQQSRNKFAEYLETINEYADTVYDDLSTLDKEGW